MHDHSLDNKIILSGMFSHAAATPQNNKLSIVNIVIVIAFVSGYVCVGDGQSLLTNQNDQTPDPL